MNYFDKLYFFFNFLQAHKVSPATQLTYLHILHKWNCVRQAKTFSLSDSELARTTNLSRTTIQQAKCVLKNFGLIDFKKKRDSFIYSLPSGKLHADEQATNQRTSQATSQPPLFSNVSNNTNNNLNNKYAPAQRGNLSENFGF